MLSKDLVDEGLRMFACSSHVTSGVQVCITLQVRHGLAVNFFEIPWGMDNYSYTNALHCDI